MSSIRLAFLSDGRCPGWRPSFTPRACAAAKPDFTRSRMRSRSNSAKPAMMVRMSLPAGGAEVEAQPRLRQHADLPAMEVIEGLDEVLGASAPAAQLRDEDGVDL